MNEGERQLAAKALTPIVAEITGEDATSAATQGTVVFIVEGLDKAHYRIREAPPLPPGTARVELLARNQFAQMGPEGKLIVGGLPAGTGVSMFTLGPGGLWVGVILHPDTQYDVKPKTRLIVPT